MFRPKNDQTDFLTNSISVKVTHFTVATCDLSLSLPPFLQPDHELKKILSVLKDCYYYHDCNGLT